LPPIALSVVIPAYNEVARVSSTLLQIVEFLDARGQPYEILVVDDGSTDATAACIEEFSRSHGRVRLVRCPANRGKGAAVRTGMLLAQGEYLLFTDADLSAPIAELDRLLEPVENGYDVAFGSRALKREWITIHQTGFRESAGKLFNLALRTITGLPFQDTQCGFKVFRKQAAQHLFARQTIDRFGFDGEVLYLARKFGYRLIEVPVHWAHREGSKVHLLRDGLRMAADLLKVRWNDWTGKYSQPANGPAP
jgi:glycosyltransferase involved in cell wall biosynthesis